MRHIDANSETNMANPLPAPKLGEPYLLTPGPLTTAYEVKESMLRDWGSRDYDFRSMTAKIRSKLVAMAGDTKGEYDCVPVQGSGTFSVEAMCGSLIPKDSKTLVLVNGAYGKRIVKILDYLGRDNVVIDKGDYLPPRGHEVTAAFQADPAISHVIVVHCETSSGILNPLKEISDAVIGGGRKLLIDSMSAFGALELDVNEIQFAAMVSSANKCIEGVPGFGFVVARKDELEASKGVSHSLSLDLYDQWTGLNKTHQWRFTPPTHVLAAFLKALELHEEEGGVAGRGARYTRNRDTLVNGMRALGFETLLQDEWLAPIILTFFNPAHPNFDFEAFYEGMSKRNFVIYPGKLTVVDSFRVGCIGRLDEHVMQAAVDAAAEVLKEMGVDDAAPPSASLDERAKIAS